MKSVRILQSPPEARLPGGAYPGNVVEVDNVTAGVLVAAGFAERLDAATVDVVEVEAEPEAEADTEAEGLEPEEE